MTPMGAKRRAAAILEQATRAVRKHSTGSPDDDHMPTIHYDTALRLMIASFLRAGAKSSTVVSRRRKLTLDDGAL